MIVLGLDTASDRFHMVSQDRYLVFQVRAKDPNPDVRRHQLVFGMKAAIEEILSQTDDQEVHIFCEEPLSLRNGKTTRLLGLAAGAIWAAHLDWDVFWHWVDVAAWKKEVIGKGNATKEDIRQWSLANGGHEDWDEDHHDAWAISHYGARMLARLD